MIPNAKSRSPFSLTLFLLLVLAVVSHASNLTDESRLKQRWVYTYDPTDDFYDDDPDEGYVKPASSNLSMLKQSKRNPP